VAGDSLPAPVFRNDARATYAGGVRSIARFNPKTERGRWLLLDEADGGVYVFEFESDLDGSSKGDFFYSGPLKDAEVVYADAIEGDWIAIGAPLQYCQQDWIWPVRVAGREIGAPRFGELERLVRRRWVPFDPQIDAVPTVKEAIREAVALTRRQR
jgi:hypothetical protein